MLRWILLAVGLGLAAWGAATLAEIPGAISLTWNDWRIDTSLGVFIGALLVLMGVAALLYRGLWTLRRAPELLGRGRRERRQRLGYEALSRGLVAVAAGDAEMARRQARRAEALLDGRSLTMLLSAQAAQLQGDDQAAQRFFLAMRERPDTEFLGVRGLLAQAVKRQDWEEALRLGERAYRLNPKSEWVVSTLFDLQKRAGRWADAEATLKQRMALHLLPAAAAPRERADILLRQSEAGPGDAALALAKKAHQADPGYPAAAARYARLLIAAGRHARAAEVIERAWQACPDPELADLYWDARQTHDALAKVKAAQRLATHNPDHVESRIAVAVAALEARLWGEARTNLESVAGENATPRVCRMMAELEEAEHGDLSRARIWLMRATADEHGPSMSSSVPERPEPLTPTAERLPTRV
ncbi:MAG TPA: heme biosynthesis HemY N-terminal domain-containing protein [Rhodospirillales bacterium]|nr:heme biosynthesis HemY N-terminal domain-containing protein [Rhodospirillales bacterium]